MRTEAPPDGPPIEIIEIIDDGIDPFGDRPANTTIHDTGGPRWVGPVAAAALVALIGYGIATSASTSSIPKVAPAPSTTISLPTTRATTQPTPTTLPPPLVPYYSADPPREYRVQYANIETDGRQRFFPGDYQVWATPGATATTGSWFAIESMRTGPQPVYAIDSFRVPAGDQSMVISHMPAGQSRIQFLIDDLVSVTITALGWGDDDLVRLAQSVAMTDGVTEGRHVSPSDPMLIGDFQLLSTVPPYIAMLGDAVEQVYYSVGSDPTLGFSIGVAPVDPDSGNGSLSDRQIALRFFLDRATPFEVDGYSAVAGAIVGQPEQAVATWIADDHIVSVAGAMTVPQLITIARTVHPVSSEEWDGMKFQAARNNGFSSDYTETEPQPVSFGTDALGEWTVTVNMSTYSGDQHGVNWQWPPGGGFGSLTDDTAKITSVVDGDRTYVVAQLPRIVAPSAQLQVTRTGLEPASTPFIDTDPSLDRTFAAFAFSEATNYTAQIVGPDGAVLATWPST